MKPKIFKTTHLLLIALLAVNTAAFAQEISVSVDTQSAGPSIRSKHDKKDIKVKVKAFTRNLELNLDELGDNLANQLNDIVPKVISDINVDLNDISPKINIDLNGAGPDVNDSYTNDDQGTGDGNIKEKFKTYSKSYPIDANDRIKLSNQYGKIMVNTWDKHEVKVDVQIRAQADDDDDAQKLLDGVQINDSKDGDQVSFKTEIQRNNSSWKIWNWGGNNKRHKVEINYTVYMPAKTDLNVEDSYGSIELPDLSGKVKISSSYGSVSAQNLANASNEIDGSYGSLKIGSMNGGRLDYSYGSADIEECNNVKADISYGSFKLGKLNGNGDFDISYVGGFKIENMASSFRKLNVNASYSNVALGVPGSDNFDFDITTSYGGFNYNDDKVTITSKTPPDGSKHIGPTRNYKGHFGKEGSESQVNIHTSYGGVNME